MLDCYRNNKKKTALKKQTFLFSITLCAEFTTAFSASAHARNSRRVAKYESKFCGIDSERECDGRRDTERNSTRFALIAFTSVRSSLARTDGRTDERTSKNVLLLILPRVISIYLCAFVRRSNLLEFCLLSRTDTANFLSEAKSVPRHRERTLHFAALHQKRLLRSPLHVLREIGNSTLI